MDELEFMRGRVYGADHEDAGPRHGRVYAESAAGPLDGLLLDVTHWKRDRDSTQEPSPRVRGAAGAEQQPGLRVGTTPWLCSTPAAAFVGGVGRPLMILRVVDVDEK